MLKIKNVILKLWKSPYLILSFIHEEAHAIEFIRANKQLGIKEKVIVVIGCKEFLYEPYPVFITLRFKYQTIIILDDWWSYIEKEKSKPKSVGFTECKNHFLYDERQIIKMAEVANKVVSIYFTFLVILFFINPFLNAFYINNLIVALFTSLIIFWIGFPAFIELRSYKKNSDYKLSINPTYFYKKESEYVKISGILEKNNNKNL